jgi:hypothetical protein
MATAVIITGYLPSGVTDSKHKSARAANGFLRSVVKAASGTVTKLEVMMGNIFITLKDDKGMKELQDALQGLDGVDVSTPSTAQLIFTKERARGEADLATEIAKQKAAQGKSAA